MGDQAGGVMRWQPGRTRRWRPGDPVPPTRAEQVLAVMADGRERTYREIVAALGVQDKRQVVGGVSELVRSGRLLRRELPYTRAGAQAALVGFRLA